MHTRRIKRADVWWVENCRDIVPFLRLGGWLPEVNTSPFP